jgi:hypothetical protein
MKERDNLGELGAGGKIILKCVLTYKTQDGAEYIVSLRIRKRSGLLYTRKCNFCLYKSGEISCELVVSCVINGGLKKSTVLIILPFPFILPRVYKACPSKFVR